MVLEVMKHPNKNSEPFVFNIGQAPKLRCVYEGKATICGQCETCQITQHVNKTRDWFPRCGDETRKRFTLGLIRRLNSIDLLDNLVRMLSPLISKDFTYARSRTHPSLNTDSASVSHDHAMSVSKVEASISSTWEWFRSSNYWTKSNFLLCVLQLCEVHLLSVTANQVKTLLVSERKATIQTDDYERASLTSSCESFHTDNNADIAFIAQTKSEYTPLCKLPFSAATYDSDAELEIINDDSGDESIDTEISLLDPSCLVIPTSIKGHAGVAKYKDFIRCLPVHLSKYILGLLDEVSLYNCLSVSRHWKQLANEIHKESILKQQLWEEVMLMQGAAAQGANPVYANDIDVPVPNLVHNSLDVKTIDEDVIHTTFKSEVSFKTAYSGVSTRKIIMEERNVYCGAYNVMVLNSDNDPHRVVHTDGGQLIAMGSKDRKVRFIDSESGKERPPVMAGHAGSIKSIYLCESKGIVFSGSYDTSIRKWSLETGKPMKIYRGHTDTIQCLTVHENRLASGAKDNCCKVWNLETAKCVRTFKHSSAVTAVALGEEFCISGCEKGSVKVWNMLDGQLIKKLAGHNNAVTAIRYDKWHIVSGGKDGYALAWSNQGRHNRCLSALRHPKAVLCVEFMYLRVITGSEDGRLRIWNMVTGQCCRIMRGNSRSDPILSINAIGNRITLNTHVNLLVLSFEPVNYDYTLENDKMPSLVQYSKYSDAPVRQQPYAYVRAQRMKRAGATNEKIVHSDHDENNNNNSTKKHGRSQSAYILQSAKSLSTRNVQSAKEIQKPDKTKIWRSDGRVEERVRLDEKTETYYATREPPASQYFSQSGKSQLSLGAPSMGSFSPSSKPPHAPSRAVSSKSRFSKPKKSVVVASPAPSSIEDVEVEYSGNRRVSWAFEQPYIPLNKELSLNETKSLLRSQIRDSDPVPPDFVYMTINAIQQSQKPKDPTNRNTYLNATTIEKFGIQLERPSSSPSKLDPRDRVPVTRSDVNKIKCYPDPYEVAESMLSLGSNDSKATKASSKFRSQHPVVNMSEPVSYTTKFKVTKLQKSPNNSVHPDHVKSTIPKGKVLRPHTASASKSASFNGSGPDQRRAVSASVTDCAHRPDTARSNFTSVSSIVSNASQLKRKKSHGYSTSATEISMVPMLMYPPDMEKKIKDLKNKSQTTVSVPRSSSEPALGCVSQYNDPMRSHVDFKLLTYEQEQTRVDRMARTVEEHNRKVREEHEKQRRAAWLAKAKGSTSSTKPPTGVACAQRSKSVRSNTSHSSHRK